MVDVVNGCGWTAVGRVYGNPAVYLTPSQCGMTAYCSSLSVWKRQKVLGGAKVAATTTRKSKQVPSKCRASAGASLDEVVGRTWI